MYTMIIVQAPQWVSEEKKVFKKVNFFLNMPTDSKVLLVIRVSDMEPKF